MNEFLNDSEAHFKRDQTNSDYENIINNESTKKYFMGSRSQHLFTIKEAANELRISTWLLYKLINTNQIDTVSIARRRLVAEIDIMNFINKQKGKNHAA